MIDLNIYDVRAVSGDSSFLIDDGKTAILYDTGFAFTGDKITQNIEKILKNRSLDYIFLTHSHYDHALGTPYVLKRYPNAKVVAGVYAEKIFSNPSARETMRDLDRKFAKKCGVFEYEDLIDTLKVDVAVKDGEKISAGDMDFTVMELPGHTRCSIGFYLEENKFLLSSETLGVYLGLDLFFPSCLVGYQMTLDSFEKVKKLGIENILVPHYKCLDKVETGYYLEKSEKVTKDAVKKIKDMLESGATDAEAFLWFEKTFYKESARPTYPKDAFDLNTSIFINLIKKELL